MLNYAVHMERLSVIWGLLGIYDMALLADELMLVTFAGTPFHCLRS